MRITATYDQIRDAIYTRYERLFPTPVQVRLIEILGGTTFVIGGVRRNNLPMTIVLSRGKLLRSRRFRRAVVDGMGCLASDIKYAIAVQGPEYERRVVEAFERDEKLEAMGWNLVYVRWQDVWQNPSKVRSDVLQFLS
jgi:hypothetical protein